MTRPFTVRTYLPTGVPDEIKIIDKMNWTGVALEIGRKAWSLARSRDEVWKTGVYILIGFDDSHDLPTIYIGQGESIGSRIDKHVKNKLFWDRAVLFTSSGVGLNRAHAAWLESMLIKKATAAKRSILDNSSVPNEPALSESERNDTHEFLDEVLAILPLINIRLFKEPEKISKPETPIELEPVGGELDTIVVPAQEEGFQNVFLNENCWYSIRIAGGKLDQIKYIAVYRTAPISAITHIATVDSIEPYGDGTKYKLIFVNKAEEIGPISLSDPNSAPQSPRYTSRKRISTALKIDELWF